MSETDGDPRLDIEIDPDTALTAQRLRDGRVAIGTRRRDSSAAWSAGELVVLRATDVLALAGWLAPMVEEVWLGTVRERAAEVRQTAFDLYGDAPDAEERLAAAMTAEIPPDLLRRAFVLLINSIGPASRDRLVAWLNRTEDFSEESMLRERLAAEQEAFGYAIAVATLFDRLHRRAEEDESTDR